VGANFSGKSANYGSLKMATLEGEVVARVNAAREEAGQPQLVRDSDLDLLARMHNQYMSANQDKLSMGGADTSYAGILGRKIASYRLFCYDNIDENVATLIPSNSDATTADELARLWEGRPNNKECMLFNSWKQTGISVMEGKGGYVFVTQIYGAKSPYVHERARRICGF